MEKWNLIPLLPGGETRGGITRITTGIKMLYYLDEDPNSTGLKR